MKKILEGGVNNVPIDVPLMFDSASGEGMTTYGWMAEGFHPTDSPEVAPPIMSDGVTRVFYVEVVNTTGVGAEGAFLASINVNIFTPNNLDELFEDFIGIIVEGTFVPATVYNSACMEGFGCQYVLLGEYSDTAWFTSIQPNVTIKLVFTE